MKTKQLIEKYWDVLSSISYANTEGNWQPDMGVALDMLKHECYARHGMFGRTPQYKGVPSNFNWSEFEKDIDLEKSKQYIRAEANKIGKTKVLVNGVIKEVKRVMVNNENYIRLRDMEDVLGICDVDYDAKRNLPIVRK